MAQAGLDDKDAEVLNRIRRGWFESADPEDIKRLTRGSLIRSQGGHLALTPLGNQMLLEWLLQKQKRP